MWKCGLRRALHNDATFTVVRFALDDDLAGWFAQTLCRRPWQVRVARQVVSFSGSRPQIHFRLFDDVAEGSKVFAAIINEEIDLSLSQAIMYLQTEGAGERFGVAARRRSDFHIKVDITAFGGGIDARAKQADPFPGHASLRRGCFQGLANVFLLAPCQANFRKRHGRILCRCSEGLQPTPVPRVVSRIDDG
jgi:hypothetical protein